MAQELARSGAAVGERRQAAVLRAGAGSLTFW